MVSFNVMKGYNSGVLTNDEFSGVFLVIRVKIYILETVAFGINKFL